MHDLVSDNQITFITSHQTIDKFMIANEIVHDLKVSENTRMIF